jgi:hypothetical protein
MTLLRDLKSAAISRGLIESSTILNAPAAFALVRDMPYQCASSLEPSATIEQWRSTCSGKHILLYALFDELGMQTTMIIAPHEFTETNSPWLPPALLTMVCEAPVRDVHNFLRVQPVGQLGLQAEWITVDATWPLPSRELGMPANEALDLKHDMGIAADPDEIFHLPPDADPNELNTRILSDFSADELARRETFLAGLINWLAQSIPDG